MWHNCKLKNDSYLLYIGIKSCFVFKPLKYEHWKLLIVFWAIKRYMFYIEMSDFKYLITLNTLNTFKIISIYNVSYNLFCYQKFVLFRSLTLSIYV